MTDANYPMGDPHAVIRLAADPNYRVPNYMTADDPIPPRPDGPSRWKPGRRTNGRTGRPPCLLAARPGRTRTRPPVATQGAC